MLINIGCGTELPYGSEFSDNVAFGKFKKYSDIQQIEIFFYTLDKKIRYSNELKNKKKITITNEEEKINFIKNLEDYSGRIGESEKLLIHGICFIKFKKEAKYKHDYVYFYFDLYEKSAYIQPPSFKNEFGGHGSANTKIFPMLYQFYQRYRIG